MYKSSDIKNNNKQSTNPTTTTGMDVYQFLSQVDYVPSNLPPTEYDASIPQEVQIS